MNDIIIDFYIKIIVSKLYTFIQPQQILIFNSFLYPKISQGKVYDKWLKGIDIFKKKLLIIPINNEKHWFLFVIFNPGYFRIKTETVKFLDISKGCIYYFDSLSYSPKPFVPHIRKFLHDQSLLENLQSNLNHFEEKKFPLVNVNCPKQTDGNSCGCFVLQYIETIISEKICGVDQITANLFEKSNKFFFFQQISEKRQTIRDEVNKLRKKQKLLPLDENGTIIDEK